MQRVTMGLRAAVGMAAVFGVMVGGVACSSRTAPVSVAPVAAVPPAPVVSPPSPAAVRYSLPVVVPEAAYRMESVAEVARDSAGRRVTQRMTSQAEVRLRLRRTVTGGVEGTGRVLKYTLSGPMQPVPVTIDSLRFDALLDSLALRVVTQPPLANECDRPETAALAMTRDLLVRIPLSMTVGDQWRDSTVSVVCRSGVPLVVHTVSRYVVMDSQGLAESNTMTGSVLHLRRTSTTRVDGAATVPWRASEIHGTGSASLDVVVAVRTGVVQRVEGVSSLVLRVTDRGPVGGGRSEEVRQSVKSQGRIIR